MSCLAPKAQNVSTGRLVNSCVPVSVERLDQDNFAYELRLRSDKNGETLEEWTIHRFVHTAR